jgi:sortase A
MSTLDERPEILSALRRPLRGEIPVLLTLPLRIERRARRGSRRARRMLLAALLLLGAALLAAGVWLPLKAEVAQQLLNRAWSATQDDRRNVRPWPWADTWPVARLRLPGEEPLTVLAGASGRNLAFAPALLDGSARLGDAGVSVIAGHRDTHFRALEKLRVGDRFAIEQADGAIYGYEVAALDVVDSDREQLRLDADESVVALVTCWPFDALTAGGSLRYVVTGRRALDRGGAQNGATSRSAVGSGSAARPGGHRDLRDRVRDQQSAGRDPQGSALRY